ncbi:MAG: ATP-binding cassette domain-containing protein [Acidimicrobiales bacterium]|nr:ATP-binding cassette domain-containing protein [Acidimicrobiales bacterium]
MLTFLQYVLLGLSGAGAYGLSALGVVTVYRGTRVLNFAHGAVGMVGAYAFYELLVRHYSLWLAIPAGLVGGGLTGLAVYVCVMYPLRASPSLNRLIGTFGVTLVLTGSATIIYGSNLRLAPAFLPRRVFHFGSGTFVSEAAIIIYGATLVMAVAMTLVFFRTRFGRMCSAIEDNRMAAAVIAIPEFRVGCLTWALGGVLASLAGILLTPVIGVSPAALTILVIPALAAGLPGEFRSVPLAVLTASVIGIGQSLITGYGLPSTTVQALPLAAVVVVLIIRGRSLPERGVPLEARLPALTPGRINIPFATALLALVAVCIIVLPSGFAIGLVFSAGTCLLGCSVIVATGYAGQLNLAPMAIAGCAAVVTANLAKPSVGLAWWLATLCGIAAAIGLGTAVGTLAARVRGVNLAVATLALALAVQYTVLTSDTFTGGYVGITLPTPHLFGAQLSLAAKPRFYAAVMIGVVALCLVTVLNVRRGVSGRRYAAVRANERGAAALGVSVPGTKVMALTVSSVYAALAGCLLLFTTKVADFSRFDLFVGLTILAYAIVGGIGFATGAIQAGIAAAGGVVGYFLNDVPSLSPYLTLIGGVLMLQLLLTYPDGIAKFTADLINEKLKRFLPWPARSRTGSGAGIRAGAPAGNHSGPGQGEPRLSPNRTEVVLRLERISKRFGASNVLSDVDLTVRAGEVVGMVGANGAGKSTLVDVMAGFTRQDSGRVWILGQDRSLRSVVKRSRAGLGRTFQGLELFEDLTGRENIQVALESRRKLGLLLDLVAPSRSTVPARIVEVARTVGIDSDLDAKVGDLPQGSRRLLALLRCLATSPRFICLDEPAAGLNEVERDRLVAALEVISERWGVAVVLIEHSMDVIRRACDRVVVLDFGRVIADGPTASVLERPDVQEAFLGRTDLEPDREPEPVDEPGARR